MKERFGDCDTFVTRTTVISVTPLALVANHDGLHRIADTLCSGMPTYNAEAYRVKMRPTLNIRKTLAIENNGF